MPYKITPTRCKTCGKSKCYKVVNKDTGEAKAKCTTLDKAKAQMRLLYLIESGGTPRKQSKKRRSPQKKSRSPRSKMRLSRTKSRKRRSN